MNGQPEGHSGRFGSYDDLIDQKYAAAGAAAWAAAPFGSMTGALATVDVQDLSGDEGGVFQKHDCVDDVLDFSHASDRMHLRKELMRFGSVHRRLHDTGSYGINPNSLFCVLDRQGFRGCV